MTDFSVSIKTDFQEVIKFFESVPREIRREVSKRIPGIQKKTKTVVKDHLSKQLGGVDQGVYKKSIVIRNLTKSDEIVEFQVGGNKRHYRLTHLLENGHRIVFFRDGQRVVMPYNTKKIPHIKPGQDYADEKVEKMYVDAINKAIKKG